MNACRFLGGVAMASALLLATAGAARSEDVARAPPILVERAASAGSTGAVPLSLVTGTFGVDLAFAPESAGGGAGLSLWAGGRYWAGDHLTLGVVGGATQFATDLTLGRSGLTGFVAARAELFSERDGFYPQHSVYALAGLGSLGGRGGPGLHAAVGVHLPSTWGASSRTRGTQGPASSVLLALLVPVMPTHLEVQLDLPLDGSHVVGPRFLLGYAF